MFIRLTLARGKNAGKAVYVNTDNISAFGPFRSEETETLYDKKDDAKAWVSFVGEDTEMYVAEDEERIRRIISDKTETANANFATALGRSLRDYGIGSN